MRKRGRFRESAVAGDDEFSTFIHTTTSFFQHEAGGVLGESSNPLIFPFIPEAAYDSWVTIGLDQAADGTSGESGVSILEGLDPWVEPFEAGGSLNIADALGRSMVAILNGASNGIAGEDKRVLLGQFTTDGNMDGQLYIQFLKTAMASMADSTSWLVCTMRVASRLMMPVNRSSKLRLRRGLFGRFRCGWCMRSTGN